ncbi:MAG: 3-oxoacyl-ACP reductase [Firmicutes bacterium HGW-Firmicutes-12]|jgi:NAD(P)-dependent dehydrogenase (short-subunit alcohol dehydrogenase family)|nr:MAG: 3-oxoacyl-ACP reductase [Firmicutes bacterium HGW-Firmicutes-12]
MTIQKGRVAIVTGAGQGIGKGIAIKLAEAGANVVACDINEKNAREVVDEIKASGYESLAVACDVGSKPDCERLVMSALNQWGRVDILVNNAGIIRDALIYKMTEEQWDAVLRVNLKGPFMMTQASIVPMKEQKFGRIINISSSACKGNIGQANYSSAKAAINALTYTSALELGKYGITVNSICPGVIDSEMVRSVPQNILDRWLAVIPAKRIGQPEDMAHMVMAYAAEEAGYLNGQTIYVDGGMQTGLKM